MEAQPFLIGSEWKISHEMVEITDPFSGREFAQVCYASPEDLEQAIQAASQAFTQTRQMPTYRRAEILYGIAKGIQEQRSEFTHLIVKEAGKPIRYARAEVDRAIQTFTFAAAAAQNPSGETLPLDVNPQSTGYWGITRAFPLGIVLGITPFNFPLNLVAHKVAPALASGNVIILKPAPQTPLTALKLAEIALAAGAPPGSINVVPCVNPLAQKLAEHPQVKLLSFTGSAEVGWKLKQLNWRKKVVLELGGNAAIVVDSNSSWERAVQKGVIGAFAFAGQICISVQRIFVYAPLFNAFVEQFIEQTRKLKVGDPAEPETVIGPVISLEAAQRLESWVREAVAGGAKLLLSGKREGRLISPMILTNTRPAMKVWREEVFGPVVLIEPYATFEQAIQMVNHSDYGLQAGVFTTDLKKIDSAYRELEVASVIINDSPLFRADNMPYGGVKQSGYGREGIRYAIQEMVTNKLLILNSNENTE